MHLFDTWTDPALIALLRGGAVGVMPTDTVYGLVCQAVDKHAVQHLYAVKHRAGKPGTVIAAKPQQLIDLGIRARYIKAVENFWPNPLSVVIPCGDELSYLHGGQQSVAVRIPADEKLRDLLDQTGALLTTSANMPNEPVATTADEVRTYFGNDLDFMVDGGTVVNRLPSTVIRIVDDAIEVLRDGAIKINEDGRIIY